MLTETITPTSPNERQGRRGGLLENVARSLVLGALQRLRDGLIEVYESDTRSCLGDRSAPADLRAVITVNDPRFYRAITWDGTLGAGQSYIDGWWDCDDLTTLNRVLLRNDDVFEELNGLLTYLSKMAQRGWHALRRNTRIGSRQNIAAHYDLSNDFYNLFLDETMTYSCGIFERADSTLNEASIAKLDLICRKLNLSADDHVIEIGTGWGSFAIHAAREYGCRVTTTTISNEQYQLARRRVSAAGLDDRVTIRQRDYRDLEGHYDKLVSIEMIEAVGWQYYDAYFRKCSELLKPDGVACIQAITIAERYYEQAKRSVDFIKRHVFPGSCIPSIGAMAAGIQRARDLTVAHLEDITPHYATTLRKWHDNFRAELPRVRELGFTEAFVRTWEYYLCYCEAGFCERSIGTVQILLTKPGFRGAVPIQRPREGKTT